MNICTQFQPNFSGKNTFTKFYIPGKNGTTLRCQSIGDLRFLSHLEYDVLHKGRILESKAYNNKKGFSDTRLAQICEKIQEKVVEGKDFLDELFDALYNGGN